MSVSTEDLEAIANEWAAAEHQGDVAFLEEALTSDFVAVGPQGLVIPKARWLGRHQPGQLVCELIRLDKHQVRTYGDTTVVICRETMRDTVEHEDGIVNTKDQFRLTLIFVRDQERWLLASLQISPILGPDS